MDDDISISSVGVCKYPKECRHVWLIASSIPALQKELTEPSVSTMRQLEAGGHLDGWRDDETEANCGISCPKEARHIISFAETTENTENISEGSWRVYISDVVTDWGMIEIGHAWAIVIPFPLMKARSTHTSSHAVHLWKQVREDNRKLCFKIKHGLYLRGCFYSWLEYAILMYRCLAYELTQ